MKNKINTEFNDRLKDNNDLSNIHTMYDLKNDLIKKTIKCRNNSNKRISTLPMLSYIYEQSGDNIKVLLMNINHKWLGEDNKDEKKFETHSEHLCIHDIKNIQGIKDKELKILVSSQPCIRCLREIAQYNIIEINYIVDKKYKMEKVWSNILIKNNITINKIDISNCEESEKAIKTINSILR